MSKIELPEQLGGREQIVHDEGRSEKGNVDFLDVALVLMREWRWVVVVSLSALALGGLVSVVMRPSYTASAAILPPQQQQSSAAFVGQLGPLVGLSSGPGNLFKNPGDLYVGILSSRTIADRLIETYHLQSRFKTATMADTRVKLQKESTFEAAKSGLITIAVVNHDPHLASDLANAYIDELYRLNSSLAITEAAQRRVFFDEELKSEKAALENAEDDLKITEQKTGLIQLSGQSEMIIRNIGELRAEIASREVQMQSLKLFATEQNPEMLRVQEEINSLKTQLANLENSQRNLQPGDVALPAGRVPEVAQEYARKLRDLRYHEALYDLLSKQYEAARIDEAKSVPLIQVVDRAVPPDKRSGPQRVLITAVSGLLGLLVACTWVLVRTGFRRMKQAPTNAARLEELRRAIRSRA